MIPCQLVASPVHVEIQEDIPKILDFPLNIPNACPALFIRFALLHQFFSRRVVVIKDGYSFEDLG